MSNRPSTKKTGYLLTALGAVFVFLNLSVFDNSKWEFPLVIGALLLVGTGFWMLSRSKN